MYASRAEAIAEGMPDSARTDAALALAGEYIDRFTGQWFDKRPAADTMTLVFDGHGRETLHLPVSPIVVSSVTIDEDEVDASDYYVYSGAGPPDERKNPKIVFESPVTEGRQNVNVIGTFGYVEDLAGTTPPLIKKACLLLALRELPLMTDADRGDEAQAARVLEERTDGHSYKLGELIVSGGSTGDPEIDNILVFYRAPIAMGYA